MPILEVKNIAKKFGRIVALRDVDFKIDEGEFVYLTGSSGAGKTTLLKCILRQVWPDAGEIILEGEDIAKLPRKKIPLLRQKIGVVFQDFKVLAERTVRENVEVALAVIGLPKSDWTARVDHVLHLVGLYDRSELFPSQLSGGELQRVSLARALVVNPKIILADEPTGNLDWETADKIIELFELINSEGKTVLMATHNMQVIERHKKRVIELKDGVVFKDTAVKADMEKSDNVGDDILAKAGKFENPADENRTDTKNDDFVRVSNIGVIDNTGEEAVEEKPIIGHPADDLPPDVETLNVKEGMDSNSGADLKKSIEHSKRKHAKKKLKKKKKNTLL